MGATTQPPKRRDLRACAFAILAIASIWALPAQAAIVDTLGVQEYPQLIAESVLVAYDMDTDTLNASSLTVTLDFGDERGVIDSVDGTGFRINGTGIALGEGTTGTVEILGRDPDLGLDSGVLLFGSITEVEFPSEDRAHDSFTVLFEVISGDLAGQVGAYALVTLANTGYPGDFAYDWANDGSGSAVTAPSAIPLPAGLWLLGAALFGLLPAARRR